MDKRKRYILVLDTETANTITLEDGQLDMSNVLVYDCGWAVIDKQGNIYETASYVNSDIFMEEKELMRSAYYANKIPQYLQDLENGSRIMANTATIQSALLNTIKRWNITAVSAHNAYFDYNALNNTQRYVTKSKERYFLPYGIEIWDTMKMANSVICKMPTYINYCNANNYLTSQGKPRKTAEILYRFISHNNEFIESHTGLEDVLIEKEILAYCFRQHKTMEKDLFPPKEDIPLTNFQINLLHSLKIKPMLNMGK